MISLNGGVMNVRNIVMEAGMSARPEYYSGRGAITLTHFNLIKE